VVWTWGGLLRRVIGTSAGRLGHRDRDRCVVVLYGRSLEKNSLHLESKKNFFTAAHIYHLIVYINITKFTNG
jgi:hypothetical protein